MTPEQKRRENREALSYVHCLLTMVVMSAFMFVTWIAAATDDKTERIDVIFSERCGHDRCGLTTEEANR